MFTVEQSLEERLKDNLDRTVNDLGREYQLHDFQKFGITRERAKIEFYKYLCIRKGLTKGLMLIKGPPRAGKTLWAVAHAKFLRDHFGIPITFDFKPEEEFGPYSYIDFDEMVEELKKVTEISKKGEAKWATDEKGIADTLKKLKLYGHAVFLDEGTRWVDRRRSTSNGNLIIIDIEKQWAHYNMLLAVINHFKSELDSRFLQYVEMQGIEVSCQWAVHWPQTGEYSIVNHGLDQKMSMTLYGPNYYPLYNSFNPIAMRAKIKL